MLLGVICNTDVLTTNYLNIYYLRKQSERPFIKLFKVNTKIVAISDKMYFGIKRKHYRVQGWLEVVELTKAQELAALRCFSFRERPAANALLHICQRHKGIWNTPTRPV